MKEFCLLLPKLVKGRININRVKEYMVNALKPNEVWEIDVKYIYIHGERENAFLCIVIDCFIRENLTYHLGKHCLKEDLIRVLEEA